MKDKQFVEEFKDALYDTMLSYMKGIVDNDLKAKNEDKWITIHPHGKGDDGDGEGKDYRRLLIKDGESVEDAMHRQGYYDKRKAKDEKSLKDLEKERDNTFLEALKAKKAGDKEKFKELTEKFNKLNEQIKNKKTGKQTGGETAKEEKPEEKKEQKSDSEIVAEIEKLGMEYSKTYHEYWDNYYSDADTKAKIKEKMDKLDEQMNNLGASLSTIGETWKNAYGEEVSFEGYDTKAHGFKVKTESKYGSSYNYYQNYDTIEKLKKADSQAYEKKTSKKGENPEQGIKLEPGKMPIASSVNEATKLALKYGLAQKVNYGKLSLDICNAMNQSANDNLAEFPAIKPYCKEFGSLQASSRSLLDEAKDIHGESIAIAIRDRIEYEKKLRGKEYVEKYYGSEKEIEKLIAAKVTKKIRAIVGADKASGEIAHCKYYPPGRQGIVWNEKFKDSKNFDYTVGFHPEGATSLKAICDHEFGHQIEHYIKDAKKQSNSYNELKSWYRTLTREQIKDELSRYATTNMAEWIAEGYAEFKNNKNCRPMAKKIGILLTAAYKEITNEQR